MWFDWEGYLGCVDPDGMARFIECANLIFQTTGYDGTPPILPWWDEFGIEYELLAPDDLRRRFPLLDPGKFYPPKRIDDPAFADDLVGELSATYNTRGFMDDPMLSAKNLAYAAPARRRVHVPLRSHGDRLDGGRRCRRGVTLASGEVDLRRRSWSTSAGRTRRSSTGSPMSWTTCRSRTDRCTPRCSRRRCRSAYGSRTARRSSATSTSACTTGPSPAGRC